MAVVTEPSTGAGLMTEVKCMNVDGELKCGKKKHHSDDDDDHHGKDRDNGTKTVKLIKQQDTCHVFTPAKGVAGRHSGDDPTAAQAERRRPATLLLQGRHFSAS